MPRLSPCPLAGVPRLPDSFRCAYQNTQATGAWLRLAVSREVDMGWMSSASSVSGTEGGSGTGSGMTPSASGPSISGFSAMGLPAALRSGGGGAGGGSLGALDAQQGLLAGAVARGVPLTVRVSAPLIVVNNTQLPLSIGVLALDAAASAAASGVGGVGDVGGGLLGGLAPSGASTTSAASSRTPTLPMVNIRKKIIETP